MEYDNDNDSLCILCEKGYYIMNGFCVENGKYLDDNEEQLNGSVPYCINYTYNDESECTKC